MSAQLRGAARVIAVDLDDERLELAAKRGCDTVNPEKANLGELVLEWTSGVGADCAIEAVGRADLIAHSAVTTTGYRLWLGQERARFYSRTPSVYQKTL